MTETEIKESEVREHKQRKKPKRILIVGRLPPPPGGVGASIESILEALSPIQNVEAVFLEWHEIRQMIMLRPDIIHFNFSKPMKRFLGSLIGRLFGSVVVHTVHGNAFDFSRFGNIAAIRLSHGFILLNEHIYERFSQQNGIKIELMTPILHSEKKDQSQTLEPQILEILSARRQKKIAVIYAHSKDYRDGVETYGMKFVADLLPQLKELGYFIVFLDTKAEYDSSELDPHKAENLIHIKKGVDFQALMEKADLYLRPTATDGNSVAVLEALEKNVPVIASDAVPRPAGVIEFTFNSKVSFLGVIKSISISGQKNKINKQEKSVYLSTSNDYLRFLSRLSNDR